MIHEWVPSTLGHGDAQCKHCLATNRELTAIGEMDHCSARKAETPVLQIVEKEQGND